MYSAFFDVFTDFFTPASRPRLEDGSYKATKQHLKGNSNVCPSSSSGEGDSPSGVSFG
jgi:hypothetical protein